MVHKYEHINTAIVGARGYTGLELAKLLLAHPRVCLKECYATKGFSLAEELNDSSALSVQCHAEESVLNSQVSLVFLATPAEVSLDLAPKLLAQKKTVIDLSGAFRLKNHDYKSWYKMEHSSPELLKKAHYGLIPWSLPPAGTQLISNPGCYATAISMALIPLLKNKLVDPGQIIIDAKSGTSGAGRKASENLLFTEVEGDCLPYKVGQHQHTPEIIEAVEQFSGVQIDPHFSTHLLPTRRGIIAGIYLRSTGANKNEILSIYRQAYQGYPLVCVDDLGVSNKNASLRRVVGTPKTHILVEQIKEKIYVYSVIDNLLKGAASQAVENFNQMIDVPITTGLEQSRGVL